MGSELQLDAAVSSTNSPIPSRPFSLFIMSTVFVGNIPYRCSVEQLTEIFSEAVPVVAFRIVYDRETGRSKGFGYCEFQDESGANNALRQLNGYEFQGRNLRVDHANRKMNEERSEMRSVFVGNLPYRCSEEQLTEVFSEAGPVASIRIVYDRKTGRSKGFGYCEFQDESGAHNALRKLNGYEFQGRNLRVDQASRK